MKIVCTFSYYNKANDLSSTEKLRNILFELDIVQLFNPYQIW